MILLALLAFSSTISNGESNETPSPYQSLIHRLSQDGFDVQLLSNLFTDSRAEFNPSALTIYLNAKEDFALYQQFLHPESILLAKKFLHRNFKVLKRMERQFYVEKEVVVAILLIESRFGENIGKFRVIPTLAGMILLDSPEHLQKIYQNLRENDPDLSYERIESFARRRAEWAYHELKCFLRIIRHETMDPLEVYGSYAGAVGMAQFIPSNYLTYALSQKGFEGWLFSNEDAINSIGNYLRSHGWKKNMTVKKKKQVLWHYNRSEPYGETVLQIVQKLKIVNR